MCCYLAYWSKGFWPMRNIETFPSKQMYFYLSLVERKEAGFYHNIDKGRYLVWFRWLIFIAFPLLYYQKENNFFCNNVLLRTCKFVTFWIERVQTKVVLNFGRHEKSDSRNRSVIFFMLKILNSCKAPFQPPTPPQLAPSPLGTICKYRSPAYQLVRCCVLNNISSQVWKLL